MSGGGVSSGPVRLSQEPDFTLGGLRVRPSLSEIEAEGEVTRLEPRVMQTLVALAKRDGGTVSREELVTQCWGGVVVGKDAVNRVISILRAIAARSDGAFRIETLSRIGYRLIAAGRTARAEPDLSVRLLAVLPFDGEGGPLASRIADGISEAILSELTRNGGMAVAARHSSFQLRGERKAQAHTALRASHVVDGAVSVEGDQLRVTAYLIDAARNVTLWSEQFDVATSEVFGVQDRIARRVADTLRVRIGQRPGGGTVDPIAYDLYTRAVLALEQPAREPVEQAVAYLTEVAARAPKFALGWAALAEAQRLRMLYRPPSEQEPERAESQRSVERALHEDPELGQAYGTLANLLPRFNRWREVEALFDRGLALTPASPSLRHLYAQFLMAVGFTEAGLDALLGLQRVNPLSAGVAVDVASALFDGGRDAEALSAVDRAYSLWPGLILVWSERVRLHVLAGHYDIVAAMLDAPPPAVGANDQNVARRRLHMVARRDQRAEDLAAASANFEAFSQIGVAPAVVAIHALTSLDLNVPALAVADQVFRTNAAPTLRPGVNMMGTYALAGEPDTAVLFRRDTASIRDTAGFDAILARIGLEDFWRESGTTPDFRREAAPRPRLPVQPLRG
jgi:TolB-like protein